MAQRSVSRANGRRERRKRLLTEVGARRIAEGTEGAVARRQRRSCAGGGGAHVYPQRTENSGRRLHHLYI